MIHVPAASQRVLLAVFAHPDDESFGPGGTLAKHAAEGAEVWLVCGTDGNAGTVEASLLTGYVSTGQLRAAKQSLLHRGTRHSLLPRIVEKT